MHITVYDVFYSKFSYHHVTATITAIFRVMLILQQHKGTHVVSCVITP